MTKDISYTTLAQIFVSRMLDLQESASADLYVGLSGGSTLPPLLEAIARVPGAEKLHRVVFTFIDERLVPYEADGSNYGAMRQAIKACGLRAVPLPCTEEPGVAEAYQRQIAGDQLPQLDLLLLGYGDDGHIASLFPGTAELNYECHPDQWIFRTEASYYPEQRWSWGMAALTNSKETYCLFKGPADGVKAQRLNDALNDPACDTPLKRFVKAVAPGSLQCFRIAQ